MTHWIVFGIFGLGGQELLIILLIILLLFGASRIPNLARGLGRGVREFKNAVNDVKSEVEKESAELEKTTKPTPKD